MGAKDEHTLKAFLEAESYDGPSLIIAYSHCIAHGIEMSTALQHQKALVESGQWLLYRSDPRRAAKRENALQLDSRTLKQPVEGFMRSENRFNQVLRGAGEHAQEIIAATQHDVDHRFKMYKYLSEQK